MLRNHAVFIILKCSMVLNCTHSLYCPLFNDNISVVNQSKWMLFDLTFANDALVPLFNIVHLCQKEFITRTKLPY